MGVASGARVAVRGSAVRSNVGNVDGQKNSGACATTQARCKPPLEKTILQQAIPA